MQPPVDVLGVPHVHRLEGGGQGIGLARHRHEMHVVRHKTIVPYLQSVGTRVVEHQEQIPPAIGVLEKDVLAPVAALRDVVRHIRDHHPCHARHGPSLPATGPVQAKNMGTVPNGRVAAT